MSLKRCPESLSELQATPEIVSCPDCDADVEIWSHEATGKCSSCNKTVDRTQTQSCVDWCQSAKECLGGEKYRGYGKMKAASRKSLLLGAMGLYFGDDTQRILHSHKAVNYAEAILACEPDADPNIVIAAAVLHDIGIKNAEAKYDSGAAAYQEIEGPPVAKDILVGIGYPPHFIEEVCDIVGHHHHPRDEESVNFQVLYDADTLVNMEEAGVDVSSSDENSNLLDRFYTPQGRRIARGIGRQC